MKNASRFAAVMLVAFSMSGCAMFGWGESEPAAAAAPVATPAPAEPAPAAAPAAKPAKKKKSTKPAATTTTK